MRLFIPFTTHVMLISIALISLYPFGLAQTNRRTNNAYDSYDQNSYQQQNQQQQQQQQTYTNTRQNNQGNSDATRSTSPTSNVLSTSNAIVLQVVLPKLPEPVQGQNGATYASIPIVLDGLSALQQTNQPQNVNGYQTGNDRATSETQSVSYSNNRQESRGQQDQYQNIKQSNRNEQDGITKIHRISNSDSSNNQNQYNTNSLTTQNRNDNRNNNQQQQTTRTAVKKFGQSSSQTTATQSYDADQRVPTRNTGSQQSKGVSSDRYANRDSQENSKVTNTRTGVDYQKPTRRYQTNSNSNHFEKPQFGPTSEDNDDDIDDDEDANANNSANNQQIVININIQPVPAAGGATGASGLASVPASTPSVYQQRASTSNTRQSYEAQVPQTPIVYPGSAAYGNSGRGRTNGRTVGQIED